MKIYQQVQQDINEMQDGMEIAGYLDGLYVAAKIFCMRYCPEEVCTTDSGDIRMSITGFNKYLNSKVVKVHRINDPVLEVLCDQSMSPEECESQISKLYKSRTKAVNL